MEPEMLISVADEPDPHGLFEAVGVRPGQVRSAVRLGLAAAARCTPFHPTSAAGFNLWSESNFGLRLICCPDGSWVPSNVANFPTIVRADGSVRITAAAASSRTGLPGLPEPITRPRGTMTKLAIEANVQGEIDFATGDFVFREKPVGVATWWVLIYVDELEARVEVSLPHAMDDQGRIVGWSRRIFLEPIPLDSPLDLGDGDDDEDSGFVDVRVEPRR